MALDGADINAVKDPWLRNKDGFCVDQMVNYGVNNIPVSDFVMTDSKSWDLPKVREFFSENDARLIMETRIPQGSVKDRIAWIGTTDGLYTFKSGYHHWSNSNMGTMGVMQSSGWSKLWRIDIPHKVKTFLWRFCRDSVPVRNRLRGKGVPLPITCPVSLKH